MPKEIFNIKDAISAKEGMVFVIIDGQRYKWMNVIDIEVKAAVENGEIKTLGDRQTKHRNVGVSIEGKMTAHWIDSTVQNMVLQLVADNKETFFDVQGVHDDPSSKSGRNVYLFPDCVIDGDIPLFTADADGEFLEQEIGFLVNGKPIQLEGFANETAIIAG